jgi:negative regulator of sigma E activity
MGDPVGDCWTGNGAQMNEEALSALVDGECDLSELDEILDEFAKDPQLRQRYSRLRMARDSRRGVRVTQPDFTFADRVVIALEREDAAAAVRIAPAVGPALDETPVAEHQLLH